MIRIFNKKENYSIRIDESVPGIAMEPNDWHDIPHVVLKLKNFHFLRHVETCETCKAFCNAFGTTSVNWHIEYLGKIRRLNLSTLGEKPNGNELSFMNSYCFRGSILRLNIDIETIESLENQLLEKEKLEEYENCAILLNKITSLKEDNNLAINY